jgi:rhodanese-related sulfurtransferase
MERGDEALRSRISPTLMVVLGGAAVAVLLLTGCGLRSGATAGTVSQGKASQQTEQPPPAPSSDASVAPDVPPSNVTTLGLYVTPTEAYDMWKADPEKVHFLDVRTFEEYVFGGHVEMAKNVPYSFPKYDPSDETIPGAPAGCSGDSNPDFVSSVAEAFGKQDTILVMCSSGGRAAQAINALAQAGFTRAYNITNGFEGESVTDTGSAYYGKKMRNGWKNDGLPWGYESDPSLMWVQPSN